MNKIVIYTAISGRFDLLPSLRNPPANIDFVCYTTEPEIKSKGVWNVVRVPKIDKNPAKTAKHYKILSHKYFPEYEISMWIDANISTRGDLNKIIAAEIKDSVFSCYKHPSGGRGPYVEAKRCLSLHKGIPANLNRQMDAYRAEGVPADMLLPATGVLIRRVNDEKVIEFEDIWWQQLSLYSCRDQISFCYAIWKTGLEWKAITTDKHDLFNLGTHKNRRK